ncbi:11901_t:CDS:2 [Dentiscutata erythropus]|uniref:11901_t:CDS:1 n=1 Tax=Dentiscutata erythropus TaxID=1348616 RepID=A0A9N9BHG5_9GLOM|nr:11901_t:CDS:2 [Dentiscutata erythropus]
MFMMFMMFEVILQECSFSYKNEVSLLDIFIAADEIQLFEISQQVEKSLLEIESAWKFPDDFITIYNDLTKWTQTDFEELEKVLHNCISHIRFYELSFNELRLVESQYKNILPNNLLDETYQYLSDPDKRDTLPKRVSAYPFNSDIIDAKDAALIASWIDNNQGMPYHFKSIPFEFKLIYRAKHESFTIPRLSHVSSKKEAIVWCKARGPCFGFQDLWIEHNNSQRFAVGKCKRNSYEKRIINKDTFEIEEYEKIFGFIVSMFKKIFGFTVSMVKTVFEFPMLILTKVFGFIIEFIGTDACCYLFWDLVI